MLGYGIQGSLAFGSNELFKELITYLDRQKDTNKEKLMPMSHVFLSGLLTGMVSTVALVTFFLIKSPTDHIRILLQKQIGITKYKGSIDAGLDIYRRFGLKGLYLGFNSTFLREVLANAVYFYSYEYIMRLFAPKGEGSSQAPIMAAFLAGGLAGSNSWLLTYPVDYVKTIMQSQHLEHLTYRSSMGCAVERYKA